MRDAMAPPMADKVMAWQGSTSAANFSCSVLGRSDSNKQDIRYNKITIRSCPQFRAIKKQEHLHHICLRMFEISKHIEAR